ncbi:hypothetical protein RHMOL_Rhmol07G0294800 [Rhododendron molle]|uniref:Uncharacterized protein n=1 Tax=Rhododendron molle TaxID=49168 RepID=A0ACC0N749_RHOML|nr:hypothetical protein RHMOL_Rhmol07G0294800 [Rhododendron molle]
MAVRRGCSGAAIAHREVREVFGAEDLDLINLPNTFWSKTTSFWLGRSQPLICEINGSKHWDRPLSGFHSDRESSVEQKA